MKLKEKIRNQDINGTFMTTQTVNQELRDTSRDETKAKDAINLIENATS
jgi:hypothetical protein